MNNLLQRIQAFSVKKPIVSDLILLVFVAGVIFLLNLGGYSLFDVDEPRYAETAREMLLPHGDWITPHFNWVTRFDKPVLFYWLIAFSYKVFGVSEFAARLVSASAAILTALMLYGCVTFVVNRRAGLYTALIFSTMLEVFAMGRWSVTDMTLTCFMTGTWLSLFLALYKHPKWYSVAGIFAGLGLLTKGPVAVALPGLTFLIMLAWRLRSRAKTLLSPWVPLGLVLCLAIALPWYIAVAQANPNEFVGSFFFFHNVERFTSTVSGHSGPWFYYIPVFLIGAFPWTLFLPASLLEWLRDKEAKPELLYFSQIWHWVVFIFFSIAGTKLLTYILPLFPTLAILFGWYFATASDRLKLSNSRQVWVLRLGVGFGFAIAAIALSIELFSPYSLIPKALQELYHPAVFQILLFLVLGTFGAAAAMIFNSASKSRILTVFLTGWVLIFAYANAFVFPQVSTLFQSDLLTFAKKATQDGRPLATFRTKKPSLVYYSRKPVYFLSDQELHHPMHHTFENHIAENKLFYVVVRQRDLPDLKSTYNPTLVKSGHVYSLMAIENPLLKDENQ